MKKLICIADIQQLINTKQNKCMIPVQTIITPAARDLADEHQIIFEVEAVPQAIEGGEMALLIKKISAEPSLLQELIAILQNQPYQSESDPSGFKLIHGETIQYCQKNSDGEEISHLLFTPSNGTEIELVKRQKGSSTRVFSNEEIHFLIEGKMVTIINNKSFSSKKGDIQYYPPNVKLTLNVMEDTHILVIRGGNKQ